MFSDEEILNFQGEKFDLIIHDLALHWANDPIGQLVQCRLSLLPDGLFLGALFGGLTLHELRSSLATAETEVSGGLSPRVAPMAEIRDLGGLLQRAGFALPVADTISLKASYLSLLDLTKDLRGMGETNALAGRVKKFTNRKLFELAEQHYHENFTDDDNRILATFEVITLTGWSPDESQQKALRPGSAKASLAAALGTKETKLDSSGD
jgi:SAM-dependent methyltransferase